MSLVVDGKTIELDPEGYLVHLDDWNEAVANKLADGEGCPLDEGHWEVIRFLRAYYDEYKITPGVRMMVRIVGKTLGREKGNSRYLYRLFPRGPAKQASKYAGLPKPTNCI